METYFNNMTAEDGTKAKLVQDLGILVKDAEELVLATGSQLAEKSRAELLRTLERVKTGCGKLQATVAVGAENADRIIRDYPYQSIGVAFGVGLLLGVLVNRDSDERE